MMVAAPYSGESESGHIPYSHLQTLLATVNRGQILLRALCYRDTTHESIL
jgi:hypothetical protein